MENLNTQGRSCPKDCRQCGFQQHAFCSAQMAYTTLTMVQELAARIGTLEKAVESVSASADLIDPASPKGDGEDNVIPGNQ